jgi:probable addiction module antidote protein
MENLRTLDDFMQEELRDPEFALDYLITALEEFEKDKDAFYLLNSLKRIAEARGGMTELARKSKISRQNLYKLFTSKSMPKLDTLDAILNALGFRLYVRPLGSSRMAS